MREPMMHPPIGHIFTDTEDGKYHTEVNPWIKREARQYNVFIKDLIKEELYKEIEYRLTFLYLIDSGEFYLKDNRSAIYTFDEIKKKIAQGDITTELPKGKGFRLRIHDIGVYPVPACTELKFMNFVKIEEFVKELEDDYNHVKGLERSGSICIRAWEEYKANPTEGNREKLREAYERVPAHYQPYLTGDMDLKDTPIRVAVYGEKEFLSNTGVLVSRLLTLKARGKR